ncbi:MAG TPA: LEA type 2 family protein [Burkholderiales bacterium]
MRRSFLLIAVIIAVLNLGGCAAMPGREPIQVTVAGIESLPGEGLELRMMVKLRVQNPNDAPVEYDGVYVKLDVLDKTFATGVSDERGSIPRYGESVISVPVTISALRVALQTLGYVLNDNLPEKVNYKLSGKLGGPTFGSLSFQADGELTLPKPGASLGE